MDDIYMFSDSTILRRIGEKLKTIRLKQNITQQSLSEAADVSLSSIKKIEKGEIGSFDSLLRVMRILGRLEVLQPLVEEEQLSPNEYYKLVQSSKTNVRKRAAGKLNNTNKEVSTW
ncbi:MAG: helix-turn-helix transcriptional regulator [Bacteroidales bacterium]|jgi:transcriptional regulator with XRE-family HTH domain|nr:helix-turn-helix transcriptional regulator [Bacteroidales bacterium]